MYVQQQGMRAEVQAHAQVGDFAHILLYVKIYYIAQQQGMEAEVQAHAQVGDRARRVKFCSKCAPFFPQLGQGIIGLEAVVLFEGGGMAGAIGGSAVQSK